MPTTIPLEIYPKERVLAEILIEEFLFFSVSAKSGTLTISPARRAGDIVKGENNVPTWKVLM